MNASNILALLLLGANPAVAEPARKSAAPVRESVAPLVQQTLPNSAGKQFTAVTVTFPPGAQAVPHRHGSAFLYAYVLEGSVRSQLEGQPVQTYRVGQGWVELPGAHHLRTENASSTVSARLLVTFVSDVGATLKTPDGR